MQVVGDGGLFGPTTMPWIVAVLCFVVAALLAFDILRPRPEFGTRHPPRRPPVTLTGTLTGTCRPTPVNAPAVLTAVGGVAAFIVVLPHLGWILSATGLFVAVAAALGNRRWPATALGGLAVSSAVQIVFSMLLGISLPAGFVGGSEAWNS